MKGNFISNFFKAAFHLGDSHHILVPGVVPPKVVEDFALLLQEIFGNQPLQPAFIWRAAWPFGESATFPGFVSSANCLRVHFYPIVEIINDDVKRASFQYWTLRYSTPWWPPDRLWESPVRSVQEERQWGGWCSSRITPMWLCIVGPTLQALLHMGPQGQQH